MDAQAARSGRGLAYLGLALVASVALLLAACGGGASVTPNDTTTGVIQVVAAENVWGSIAAQLGGTHARVTSIIASPDTDPHDYEATPADGRVFAQAQYVVVNGLGYDPWADQLLSGNPVKTRVTLRVQDVLGLKNDDNPHRWYSPTDVMTVIDRITTDYQRIDPAHAAYFSQQKHDFIANGLQEYSTLVQRIRERYAGTAVAATESIVAPLTDALGLDLITPRGFLYAISEGSDPTAQDKVTFDRQIKNRAMAVLLFNTQNATPDVQRLIDAASAQSIPIVPMTETLTPANATFQEWQTRQLQALEEALHPATGQ